MIASHPATPARSGARPDLLHAISIVLPLTTAAYLLAPSHGRYIALVWVGALLTIGILDERGRPIKRDFPASSSRLLGALVLALAGLQLTNLGLMVCWLSGQALFTVDSAITVVLVGVGSAFTTVIVSHELIHRPRAPARWLGRALLWTVFYDHFFTDHLRGHHRRVGTTGDPLTARYGETFWRYLARSWPGEFKSAWAIEVRRLGPEGAGLGLARSEVVRGAAAELALTAGIGLFFGAPVAFLFVAQAAVAHVLIVSVNYFEHWGIARRPGKLGATGAWDSTAPLSYYALLGLSLHADHHVHASYPFECLRLHDESPKLPRGYFAMVALVLLNNRKARALMAAELARKGLTPSCSSPST